MKKRSVSAKCLTPEEAMRLENILTDRIHIIRHTIIKVFSGTYDDLVEDCVSEVLLLACEKSDVLLQHDNPGGWLVNASKNLAYNAIRKRQNEMRNVPIDDLPSVPSPDDVVEDMIFDEWMKKGIPELLLSRLTPKEREVYDLLFVQKETPQAVATKLHISYSRVRGIKKSIMEKIKNDVYAHNFRDF